MTDNRENSCESSKDSGREYSNFTTDEEGTSDEILREDSEGPQSVEDPSVTVAQVGNQDPTTWVAPNVRLTGPYFTTGQDEVFDGMAWYGPEGEDVNEEGRQEDWTMYIPTTVHQICLIYEVDRIPVFDIWFREL